MHHQEQWRVQGLAGAHEMLEGLADEVVQEPAEDGTQPVLVVERDADITSSGSLGTSQAVAVHLVLRSVRQQPEAAED